MKEHSASSATVLLSLDRLALLPGFVWVQSCNMNVQQVCVKFCEVFSIVL